MPLTSCWGAGKPCNSGHQSRERPVRSAAMFSMRVEPENSVLSKIVPCYHTTWKLFILTKTRCAWLPGHPQVNASSSINKSMDSIESEAKEYMACTNINADWVQDGARCQGAPQVQEAAPASTHAGGPAASQYPRCKRRNQQPHSIST